MCSGNRGNPKPYVGDQSALTPRGAVGFGSTYEPSSLFSSNQGTAGVVNTDTDMESASKQGQGVGMQATSARPLRYLGSNSLNLVTGRIKNGRVIS
jgi:hypothetical protein